MTDRFAPGSAGSERVLARLGLRPGYEPEKSVKEKILHYLMNDSIPAGVVKSAWSGFTLPGDVYRGAANPDDYGRALDTAGLATMGGTSAARMPQTAEKLVSKRANIYDPPVKSARSFEADYPGGAVADDAGQLQFDIDGRPLGGRYVVGRADASGLDVALPREALDEIAKARTGSAIRTAAPGSSELGRDVGRTVFRRDGRPDRVVVSGALTDAQTPRVAAHEIAHVIDQTAGKIPIDGLHDELRLIYNDLNNPQNYGKKFGPEQSRYAKSDVPRELMAEAIRAYMADPNYIKTVAPKTAARIRAHVNAHPKLKDTIQFNSGGALPLAARGLAGWEEPKPDEEFLQALLEGRGA